MGAGEVIHLRIPVIVLDRCHPWGRCNFCGCFLSVGFPFPKAPPEEKLAELCLSSLNFQCLPPVVGTPQVTQDRRALECFPGREHTVSGCRRSRVATVSFGINLSEDSEAYLEAGKDGTPVAIPEGS